MELGSEKVRKGSREGQKVWGEEAGGQEKELIHDIRKWGGRQVDK